MKKEQSIHKSKEEKNLTIVKGHHVINYKILIWFSNGKQRIINFGPLFNKFVKGYYSSHFIPSNFKKFAVANGNISWGENEEVIFPVAFLYNSKYGITQKEEVLYVFLEKEL